MSALLTSLLGLNERLSEDNFSIEGVIILTKSSLLRLGREANPSSSNSCFPRLRVPADVTFLQKLMLSTLSSSHLPSCSRQASVIAFSR